MTAEIVIVNRQGIAIAADSAVTTGKNRVWKSANKLFSLGSNNDIAIMIYNSGDFAGFPWEIIVKEFRKFLNGRKFDLVSECEAEFFDYLKSSIFLTTEQGKLSVLLLFMNFLDTFFARVEKYKTRSQLQSDLAQHIQSVDAILIQEDQLSGVIPKSLFVSTFRADISSLAREHFGFQLVKTSLDPQSSPHF